MSHFVTRYLITQSTGGLNPLTLARVVALTDTKKYIFSAYRPNLGAFIFLVLSNFNFVYEIIQTD